MIKPRPGLYTFIFFIVYMIVGGWWILLFSPEAFTYITGILCVICYAIGSDPKSYEEDGRCCHCKD